MAYDLIEASDKIDYLENIMAQLAYNVNQVSVNISRFSHEMQEFKGEMRVFRNKMDTVIRDMQQDTAESKERLDNIIRDMRQDTAESKERLDSIIRDMQQDTAEFKRKVEQDTAELKQELKAESRKLNQHVASISDKMGTMAEDMVAPSIPRILKEAVNCAEEPTMIGVRIRKGLSEGRSQEYDVVAVCGNYVVINETKSKLRPGDLPAFRELMQQAHDFFPEYVGYQFIGALATFYVDPSLITAGERQGFIMLGVIDGLMEILNRDGFTPTVF